jgi:hypothetical protein
MFVFGVCMVQMILTSYGSWGGGGGASLACSCFVVGDVRMFGYGLRSEIDDLLVGTHINLGPAH